MVQLYLFITVILAALFVTRITLKTDQIGLLLSFSGAFLLSVTVLHLLPDFYKLKIHNMGIYILLGILVQSILEFFSQGAEHGHIHSHENKRFPWLLFAGLSVHAFFAGIPVDEHSNQALLSAIIIHKVPIAMVLATFLGNSDIPKKQAWALIVFFALMSPIGSYLSINNTFISDYKTEIDGFIIGVFLHISTIILFESSKNHQFNLIKFISVLLGFGLAFWA